jgi:hypothetical protein
VTGVIGLSVAATCVTALAAARDRRGATSKSW